MVLSFLSKWEKDMRIYSTTFFFRENTANGKFVYILVLNGVRFGERATRKEARAWWHEQNDVTSMENI